MRKNIIYAVQEYGPMSIQFYYRKDSSPIFLFSIRNRKTIFYFFRDGKSIPELCNSKSWRNNRTLARFITGHLSCVIKKIQKGDYAYE